MHAPMSWRDKSAFLRDRYPLQAGCLIVVLAASAQAHAPSAALLAWIAGAILAALTANRLAWLLLPSLKAPPPGPGR